jgi:prepilin-type N-terminal cleavage/methylation domain-containing protein
VRYQRRRDDAGSWEAGFSLVEMLAVLALIAVVVAIGIPIVNEQVRIAEVRSAADQIAVDMRAARMIAVSKHKSIPFTINIDPVNTYSYEGTTGATRTIAMPGRVKIKNGSATSVTFKQDGSVAAAATVTVESAVSASTERWAIAVNTLGFAKLTHTRL